MTCDRILSHMRSHFPNPHIPYPTSHQKLRGNHVFPKPSSSAIALLGREAYRFDIMLSAATAHLPSRDRFTRKGGISRSVCVARIASTEAPAKNLVSGMLVESDRPC